MIFEIAKAELRLKKANIKKYPFASIIDAIAALVFIPIFMYLYKYLNLNNNIYSLAFFTVYISAMMAPKNIYSESVNTGRFEQIFTGITTIFNSTLIKVIIGILLMALVPMFLLVFANYFIAPINISIGNLMIIFMLFVTYGLTLGYILLGMQFKFRKIDAFFNLLMSNLIILSAIPLNEISSFYRNIILFLAPCGGVIGYAQRLNIAYIFSDKVLYLGMIINFIIYLVLSIFCYSKFYKSASKNGTLGWY